MKSIVFSALLAALCLAALVQGTMHGESRRGLHHGQHHHGVHARQPTVARRSNQGRCKPRTTSITSSSKSAAPPPPSPKPKASSQSSGSGSSGSSSSGSSSSSNNAASGLISVKSNCGASGATQDITTVSGPNGNINWLNCGISKSDPNSPWNPPYIRVQDIKSVDLRAALTSGNSPFQRCSAYVDYFEQYGKANGLPPILLASIAMQESSCDPNTVGGAGEQGLMQLTKDKCGDAPDGDCKNPNYNIKTGANYFATTLASLGGDLLKTIGAYNGWPPNMSYNHATAAGDTNCCRCQNNLDYLHQFLNGWCQNHDAYNGNPKLGLYFNLDHCPAA